MAVLTPYRRILSTPGAARFSLAGLVGRLPISMVGLGIVLLVEGATGSYGVAASVSAAYMAANAILAILQGRLLDALGQARVLAAASAAFGVATVLLTWSVQADWPLGVSCVFAALAGGSLPQIGSCVRARWSYVLDQPASVQTAFALEAVLDEVVFVIGPIVVTILATSLHPVAGLATAVVAGVAGSLAFAAQRATEPPAHQRTTDTVRAPMPWRTVVPLTVVSGALGILFGAAEVTTVAFAEEHGSPGAAGPLLAIWALGSLIAGVVTGAITWTRSPAYRARWGATAMAVAMVLPCVVDTVPLLAVALFVGGFSISPTLVAGLSLVEQVVPGSRLTEGMAIVQTGLVLGVAPGAVLSGFVVDHEGASAAYLVSLGAGVVAALAALSLPLGSASTEDVEGAAA